MEIVSPDSVERDWHDKYAKYEAAGVRESWIIDPLAQRAEVHALSSDGKYERVAEREGWLSSTVVAGFRVKPAWFWPAIRPKVRGALAELERSAP
jgi:Uma2 family endonuclease